MEEYETLSLRARRKKPSVSLSCCFNPGHQRADSFDAVSSTSVIPSPTNRLSPSSLKGRCKNLMSRMGRHRRHSSADFSYDPLSYSLNFQQDNDESDHYDDFPVRSFASRLPLSPPGSRRTAALIPPCTTTIRPRTSSQLGARAAAVAEVRKSLEEEEDAMMKPAWNQLDGIHDLPKTTPRKVSTATGAERRNIDLLTSPTTRLAAPNLVRRGYEYDYEDVSPALVVSPTQRHVLVELC